MDFPTDTTTPRTSRGKRGLENDREPGAKRYPGGTCGKGPNGTGLDSRDGGGRNPGSCGHSGFQKFMSIYVQYISHCFNVMLRLRSPENSFKYTLIIATVF
jgi:hypothetical protein